MLPASSVQFLAVFLSWGVVLLVVAIGAFAALGVWFSTGRGPAWLAAIPAALALGSSLHAADSQSEVVGPWEPVTITSVLGVPVAVSRTRSLVGQELVVSWPTRSGVGTALGVGLAFLLAMRRVGRPVPPITVDAAGLTWWPVRRHGPRLAATLVLVVLLAAWLLSHTDRDVADPAFRPVASLTPSSAFPLAVLALMAVLATLTGGRAVRRLRVTPDAVLLEREGESPLTVALVDLAYVSVDTPSALRHRSLELHVGHPEVRRTHLVPADGSTDDEVEQVRAAITEAKLRASAPPAEMPPPPEALAALRQSPAARSRAASER